MQTILTKPQFLLGFVKDSCIRLRNSKGKYNSLQNPIFSGVSSWGIAMEFSKRSLSVQESKVVLALTENGSRQTTREEIIQLLDGRLKAADHVIHSLRRKGWLERASWGHYLFIPPEHGPDAIGNSNLLALASRIAPPYYIGFGTAASHYGLTTQHRNIIYVVTPKQKRERTIGDSKVRIVIQAQSKFFGFGPVDVLGYTVMLSNREKTAIDCIDHPHLAGGVGEVAAILATATRRRFDWNKAAEYLERIHAGALARRVGWLADFAQANIPPDARSRIEAVAALSRKTWLGIAPAIENVPGALGYDEKWRIFINVTAKDLNGTAGTGRHKFINKETP